MPESSLPSEPLPQDSGSFLQLSPGFQLLAIREAFERAWKGERVPEIRTFLKGLAPPLVMEAVGALVADDWECRRDRKLPCSLDEYIAALPEFEPKVREVLAGVIAAEESGDLRRADTSTVEVGVGFDTAVNKPEKEIEPSQISHFRLENVLGRGAFGEVYRGVNVSDGQHVAIKLAYTERVSNEQSAQQFLAEAEVLAQLHHPNIVQVLESGSTDEGQCYVVSQLIEGGDLARRMKKSPYSVVDSVNLIADLADALHYAHQRVIVHRDIKPANILLDSQGKPYLADFGLALTDDDYGVGQLGQHAGSPAYMSPEQARGESHLVDGRTDVYALGVILYELLTGRRPFTVKALENPNLDSNERYQAIRELLRRISEVEVRPPRQLDDTIPRELERICLKALSKRAADRYLTAGDLAEDLRAFLSGSPEPETTQEPARIIPKGLRSFTAEDADFFLELLPGPHDRTGLPESLRFWKTRIEQRDPDETFRVGLIYGPSGCGKSSLMKAGLLPRLSNSVVAIYVEATANETEVRLVSALHKHCPDLRGQSSLHAILLSVRRGQGIVGGRKLLLVIDQFEQWLHAQHDPERSELVQALRQCDGEHLQCLVMVREDFWMAVTRFLRILEISQLEGHNVAAVDLFPEAHARKTLAAFGRAFEALGDESAALTAEQESFIRESVAGLANDGKVICVRLSLFAEMLKAKPWTAATLQAVGGTHGLGETFLEETFSASSAPPEHRYHQKAARSILKSLLPQAGTDIKGHWRSRDELLAASGYAQHPRDFDDVLRILDAELRLITPTDPEGQQLDDEDAKSSIATGGQYYQLTHDYLVPSLRDWLTRKQKETRRGRAELRLAERSAAWNAKPENRHLPNAFEYANIRLFTSKKNWTKPERRLMRKAGQSHGLRWGSGLALVLAVAIGLQQWISATNNRNMVERIQTAVAAMGTSRGVLVPRDIEKLEDEDFDRNIVVRELQSAYVQANDADKLGLAYALAHFGEVDVEFLVSQIRDQPASELTNLVTALRASTESVADVLAKYAGQSDVDKDWIFKSRLATVALRLGDSSIAAEMLRAFPDGPLPQAWDPIQRTTFISEFDAFCEAPEEAVAAVSGTPDLELRSGMCLALAQIDSPAQATQDAWQETLSHWATTSPDSGTHSAARLVMSRWGLPVPAIEATRLPASDRDWWHTPKGHRMVRIRPGVVTNEDGEPVEVTSELWLSDTEVTVAQFEEFMADPEIASADCPPEKKPTDWEGAYPFNGLSESDQQSHPVQQVSWYDAVMFCNWLSEKEGREPCYSIAVDGTDQFLGLAQYIVTARDSGSGYRLPTEAEWEYACRAMTATAYAFGESESPLVDYGRFDSNSELWDYGSFDSNSELRSSAVGSYFPNGWGLFDLHGNVWEWCWDTIDDSSRVNRGGCWCDSSGRCRSSNRFRSVPSSRNEYIGFRLALVPSSK